MTTKQINNINITELTHLSEVIDMMSEYSSSTQQDIADLILGDELEPFVESNLSYWQAIEYLQQVDNQQDVMDDLTFPDDVLTNSMVINPDNFSKFGKDLATSDPESATILLDELLYWRNQQGRI